MGPGGHGGNAAVSPCRNPVAHATCAPSGLVSGSPEFGTPQVPCVVWIAAGSLVTPAVSVLPCQQLPGFSGLLISARSPFVSFPKNPLPLSLFAVTSLPQSSK